MQRDRFRCYLVTKGADGRIHGAIAERPMDELPEGDVLIDPAGVVRLHHASRGPADRPTVESILQVVRAQRNHHGGTEGTEKTGA